MSLIEPFLPHRAPPIDTETQRRRHKQQERESAALLRQLRAELSLMRRWRDTEREERRQDG
jgi:hypothetical protein